jgi:hypothetical protein
MDGAEQAYSWFPSELADFCSSDCDRLAFLVAYARKRRIPHNVVEISGSRHLIVRFGDEAYDGTKSVKNLVAHYDRGVSSPGANDNGAAVFQLLKLAEGLKESRYRHNVQVIFTGNEELGPSDRVEAQGSYALAKAMRRLRSTDVFLVFDVCGSGNTIILSTAANGFSAQGSEGDASALLYRSLESTLAASVPGLFTTLPIPFSDNLGIMKAGLPAVAFTVLPAAEAEQYRKSIGRSPDFGKSVIAHQGGKDRKPVALSEGYPETWRRLHTPFDTPASLDAGAFALMERVLETVSHLELPVIPRSR